MVLKSRPRKEKAGDIHRVEAILQHQLRDSEGYQAKVGLRSASGVMLFGPIGPDTVSQGQEDFEEVCSTRLRTEPRFERAEPIDPVASGILTPRRRKQRDHDSTGSERNSTQETASGTVMKHGEDSFLYSFLDSCCGIPVMANT
mmetsp:Transcript_14871/g.43352  ORF Transcript_14871/g.43352 Transcript_14871/m.43352 type:complete len:144 (-) Transcript_14871:256-687(-)